MLLLLVLLLLLCQLPTPWRSCIACIMLPPRLEDWWLGPNNRRQYLTDNLLSVYHGATVQECATILQKEAKCSFNATLHCLWVAANLSEKGFSCSLTPLLANPLISTPSDLSFCLPWNIMGGVSKSPTWIYLLSIIDLYYKLYAQWH